MCRRRRTREDVALAIARLSREELLPLDTLAAEFTPRPVSPDHLKRWIVEGRRGVHLDGLHRPGGGWLSSREAVARFKSECGEG